MMLLQCIVLMIVFYRDDESGGSGTFDCGASSPTDLFSSWKVISKACFCNSPSLMSSVEEKTSSR